VWTTRPERNCGRIDGKGLRESECVARSSTLNMEQICPRTAPQKFAQLAVTGVRTSTPTVTSFLLQMIKRSLQCVRDVGGAVRAFQRHMLPLSSGSMQKPDNRLDIII
jgi:hypothetical protein